MIRYNVTPNNLEELVEEHKPGWLDRAATRTETFVDQRRYDESSSIWSEIKPVFIRIQGAKCIFCERALEGGPFGPIQHDLEHFRPKGSVKKWPKRGHPIRYDFEMGSAARTGYYWLAYDLMNYATSCKSCNSTLKSNYFPISKPRGTPLDSVSRLTSREKPFLCYPIGSVDEDPQKLITFDATTAVPVGRRGHKRRRGEVIIDFFSLNRRDDLHIERARMIASLGNALDLISMGRRVSKNQMIVNDVLSPIAPHSACSNSYFELWKSDQDRAYEVLDLCIDFLSSRGQGG